MNKDRKIRKALLRPLHRVIGEPEERLIRRARTSYERVSRLPHHSPQRDQGIEELHRLLVKLETIAQNDRSHGWRAEAEPLIESIDKLMPIPNRP